MKATGAILMGTLTLLLGGAALAGAPLRSLYPLARPTQQHEQRPVVFETVISDRGVQTSPRPILRPAQGTGQVSREQPNAAVFVASRLGVRLSLRPLTRPKFRRQNIRQAAQTPIPARVVTSRQGSVCGVRTIKGVKLSPIAARLPGCGMQRPVRVSSVEGVALSQEAIMDCDTAKALKTWVKNGVIPTIGRLGGGVSSLQVIAHYSCRTRNSKAGAKISEHGKGRAIDIAAINLKNGVSLSVEQGWNDPVLGKLLRSLHRRACGPFGTVLGPDSDRFHRDHFHLDTARYRGGSYCR